MLTLRRRLVLANLAVIFVTLIVLVAVISHQILGHFYEQLDRELATSAVYVAGRLTLSEDRVHLGGDVLQAGSDPDAQGFVRLLDDEGHIVDGVGVFNGTPVRPASLAANPRGRAANQRDEDGRLLRVYTLPVYATQTAYGPSAVEQRYVQVAAEPEEVLEIVRQIRRSLLLGIPLALIFAAMTGMAAAGKALQPLEIMTRSAADISADSLAERRLPIPDSHDELQALAVAFNATLARLSAAFSRQRRFTADASHELRTPVAAILGQAELALSRPRTPDVYQETLLRIQSEAERMQRLIGRLLMLARAESGQQLLSFASTDLTALLQALTESLAETIDAGMVRLTLRASPGVVVITDADSLTQVLLNLLENAVAYTKQGAVDVNLTMHTDHVVIQISDDGPGIAPEDLDAIFEPFYRADASRRRENGSVGLGLALAHELTYLLGGQITAANGADGGAIFTVSLPVQPPQDLSGGHIRNTNKNHPVA